MKINLFFDPNVRGHIIEYLHHTYIYTKNSTDQFVYVVSPFFRERSKTLNWPERCNVKIVYMTEGEVKKCSQLNKMKAAWWISKLISQYAEREKATHVFLNYLKNALPFILFKLPKNCKASGIIYSNYLNKRQSRFNYKIIIEKMFYVLLAHNNKIGNILLLNDAQSASYFNKTMHSNKFKPIVDPINNVDFSKLKDLRTDLQIPKENRIFLQFGSLDKRKNTLTILDAALGISDKELSKITLIFAGRLYDNIKQEFNEKINLLKQKTQVIVLEGFLSFEFLFSLCKTVDCIFTCYDNIEQSSGTIGYASLFRTPVIGPDKGLLGKLINEYELGVTLSSVTAEEIRSAMLISQLPIPDQKYARTNTIEKFAKTIMGVLQ